MSEQKQTQTPSLNSAMPWFQTGLAHYDRGVAKAKANLGMLVGMAQQLQDAKYAERMEDRFDKDGNKDKDKDKDKNTNDGNKEEKRDTTVLEEAIKESLNKQMPEHSKKILQKGYFSKAEWDDLLFEYGAVAKALGTGLRTAAMGLPKNSSNLLRSVASKSALRVDKWGRNLGKLGTAAMGAGFGLDAWDAITNKDEKEGFDRWSQPAVSGAILGGSLLGSSVAGPAGVAYATASILGTMKADKYNKEDRERMKQLAKQAVPFLEQYTLDSIKKELDTGKLNPNDLDVTYVNKRVRSLAEEVLPKLKTEYIDSVGFDRSDQEGVETFFGESINRWLGRSPLDQMKDYYLDIGKKQYEQDLNNELSFARSAIRAGDSDAFVRGIVGYASKKWALNNHKWR